MVSVKVQQQKGGQYMVTIPKQLAEAYGIEKGSTLIWKVAGAGRLELHLK